MTQASYAVTSFLGGEWSTVAQGRFDLPQYKTAMNVCLNGLPIEPGAWTRRSGIQTLGHTLINAPGRLIPFTIEEFQPYNIEFTGNFIRFWSGPTIVNDNAPLTVSTISTANPAIVTFSTTPTWVNGYGNFVGLGTLCPLLQNRDFFFTQVSGATYSLADGLSGASIDGSTLGWVTPTPLPTVNHQVLFTTPWNASQIGAVRIVQSEQTGVILHPNVAPWALSVTAAPTTASFATFSLNQASFIDGPYLDPFINGVQATPSAVSGIITISLSFPAYAATTAYAKGAFVTSSSVNYISIQDQNVNNTPASSPLFWTPVSAATAISPLGFVSTDVGRLVRLASEPPLWVVGTTYAIGNGVTYLGAYYTSLTASNTGNAPGIDLTHWQINPTALQWTWGKITALQNQISPSGSTPIGSLTSGGGLSASFDGNLLKSSSACSILLTGNQNTQATFHAFVGLHLASGSAIGSLTIVPSISGSMIVNTSGGGTQVAGNFRLYGSATSPSGGTNGTLLGQTPSYLSGDPTLLAPINIVSSDQATSWNYIWVDCELTVYPNGGTVAGEAVICQVELFSPLGTGGGNAISVEILGAPLLYTTPIRNWRLGLYSGTTGWPTCGTYHESRLWLSGSVGNRVDASMAGGGANLFNFAPTTADGTVTDANAIDYTFSAPDTNTIYWMEPDAQGIICGTQAGEWLIQASALNQPLTPTSMQAHRVTKVGCANILPRRTDHTLVFVQKFQRKVIEYFADVYSGKFSAPDLSQLNRTIFIPNIQELAYQQELAPIIWARMGDGSLAGCTYKRDSLTTSNGPTFFGWHRHQHGNSGRTVQSIAVGPSVGGNLETLSMITFNSAAGTWWVESMQDLYQDNITTLANGFFLDGAIVASSYSTTSTTITVNGFFYYASATTLFAVAGGLYLGPVSINSSGQFTFTFGTDPAGLFTAAFVSAFNGVMPIYVGSNFTSQGQIVRPQTREDTGARQGPGFAKKRRSHGYGALFANTQAVSIGTTFGRLNKVNFTTGADGGLPLNALTLKTGMQVTTLTDDLSFDSMVCWQVNTPYPCTIAALGGFIVTEDH